MKIHLVEIEDQVSNGKTTDIDVAELLDHICEKLSYKYHKLRRFLSLGMMLKRISESLIRHTALIFLKMARFFTIYNLEGNQIT